MLALKITDVKDFMNKLLIGEVFDQFWLTEASIATFSVFHIDGQLQPDFFDTDTREELAQTQRTYALWKEVKSYCYSIVRGKRTPLYFKIVFQLSRRKTAAAAASMDTGIPPGEISGFFLNLQYKNGGLLCTTGTSLKTFVPGKRPDCSWDSMVLDFFRQNRILFEQM